MFDIAYDYQYWKKKNDTHIKRIYEDLKFWL